MDYMDILYMDILYMDYMDILHMDILYMDIFYMDILHMDILYMDILHMDILYMDILSFKSAVQPEWVLSVAVRLSCIWLFWVLSGLFLKGKTSRRLRPWCNKICVEWKTV